MKNKRILNVVSLAVCFMLMASVAVVRDGRLFGRELEEQQLEPADSSITEIDGKIIVDTSELGKDIQGYQGPVPVVLTVEEGLVIKIEPKQNVETPAFFDRVTESGIMDCWIGKTVDEALAAQVDAVSGATYSSKALIDNVRLGLEKVATVPGVQKDDTQLMQDEFGWKTTFALLVALAGLLLPLILKGSKWYRPVQQLLNVGVLGFWCGTFLSYSLMVNFLANGIDWVAASAAVVMLLAAFVMPLFGRANHYCNWICPLGSLQDLAGRCVKVKLPIRPGVAKALSWFRNLLWMVLMLLLWCGIGYEWMDYEPFSAFLVTDASAVVLAIAGATVVLSLFIPRPFCRFVCPTGTLFKNSQDLTE